MMDGGSSWRHVVGRLADLVEAQDGFAADGGLDQAAARARHRQMLSVLEDLSIHDFDETSPMPKSMPERLHDGVTVK